MKTHVLKQGQLKKLACKLVETQGPCSYHGHWMKKLTQRKVVMKTWEGFSERGDVVEVLT